MKTTFTTEQLNVMTELANYIKLKGLVIETKKDMDNAFSSYLQSNATNYYFKSEELEKKQFANNIKLN
jgi:hypothetical protein